MRIPKNFHTKDNYSTSVPSGSHPNPNPNPPGSPGGTTTGSAASVPMSAKGYLEEYNDRYMGEGVFRDEWLQFDYYNIPYLVGDSFTFIAYSDPTTFVDNTDPDNPTTSNREVSIRLRLYNQFTDTSTVGPEVNLSGHENPTLTRFDWNISSYFPKNTFVDMRVIFEVFYPIGTNYTPVEAMLLYVNNASVIGAQNPAKVTVTDTPYVTNAG